VWGHELTKCLQEIFKTGVDGVISDQPTSNKKYCAGIAAAEWSGKLSGGSDLIRAMQRWAGVTADHPRAPEKTRHTGRRRDQLPVCDGQGFTGVV